MSFSGTIRKSYLLPVVPKALYKQEIKVFVLSFENKFDFHLPHISAIAGSEEEPALFLFSLIIIFNSELL